MLLRLPYLYYTRITRVFEDADMGIDDLKRGIFENARQQREFIDSMEPVSARCSSPALRAYQDINDTWVAFVNSLIKEWKTLNIISALLLMSMLAYFVSIMSFVWRTGAATDSDHQPLSDMSILAPRVLFSPFDIFWYFKNSKILKMKRDEYFEPVDPFTPSVALSLRNLFGKKGGQKEENAAGDDLTSLPPMNTRDARKKTQIRAGQGWDNWGGGPYFVPPQPSYVVPGQTAIPPVIPSALPSWIPPVIPSPPTQQPAVIPEPEILSTSSRGPARIPPVIPNVAARRDSIPAWNPTHYRSQSRSRSRVRVKSAWRTVTRPAGFNPVPEIPDPGLIPPVFGSPSGARPAWRPVKPRRYAMARSPSPSPPRGRTRTRTPSRRRGSSHRSPRSLYSRSRKSERLSRERTPSRHRSRSRSRSRMSARVSSIPRPQILDNPQINISNPNIGSAPYDPHSVLTSAPDDASDDSSVFGRASPDFNTEPAVYNPTAPIIISRSRSRSRSSSRYSRRRRRMTPPSPQIIQIPPTLPAITLPRTSTPHVPVVIQQPVSIPAPISTMPPLITPERRSRSRSSSQSYARSYHSDHSRPSFPPIIPAPQTIPVPIPTASIPMINHPSMPPRHLSLSRRSSRSSRRRYSPSRSQPIVVMDPSPPASPPMLLPSRSSSCRGRTRCRRSRSRTHCRRATPPSPVPTIEQPTHVVARPCPEPPTVVYPVPASQRTYRRSDASLSPSVSSESGYTFPREPNIIPGAPDPNSLRVSNDSLDEKQTDPGSTESAAQSKESFLSQTWPYILAFLIDTIPRQIYLHLLLRLPYLYFTRVSRIFEEAEMSIPEIKQGILETAQQQRELLPKMANAWAFEPPVASEPYENLNKSWTGFIDSLLKEWKTLNIISVLLLTAILTVLQLDGAGTDPLTRFTALISMICALMSLLFGCMYIIRFGTMRKTYKAAEWASEAKRSRTGIFWNVWVMLAMPAAWLAWSMISYIVCVMSFVWRTGTMADSEREPLTDKDVLIPRIVVSVVLSLGLIYFMLIALTLRRYGALMDRAWQRRIQDWIYEIANAGYGSTANITGTQNPFTVNEKPASPYLPNLGSSSHTRPPYTPNFVPSNTQPPLADSFPYPFPRMPSPIPPNAYPVQQSAMGKGGKNVGIHWDSKAKVDSSVVSLYPPSEIKQPEGSPSAFVEPLYTKFSTLFASSVTPHVNMYSRPPTPSFQPISRTPSPIPVDPPKIKPPLIPVTRLVSLTDGDPFVSIPPSTRDLTCCGLYLDKWKEFNDDAKRNWNMISDLYAVNEDHPIHACIAHWNKTYFNLGLGQIHLCEERSGDPQSGRKFAIYYFGVNQDLPYDDTRYVVSGLDVQRVDVLGPFGRVRADDLELRRLSLFATHLYIGDELLTENVARELDHTDQGEIHKGKKANHLLVMKRQEHYDPVDPFKPSVALSLRNLFGRRAGASDTPSEDDLTSAPNRVENYDFDNSEYETAPQPSEFPSHVSVTTASAATPQSDCTSSPLSYVDALPDSDPYASIASCSMPVDGLCRCASDRHDHNGYCSSVHQQPTPPTVTPPSHTAIPPQIPMTLPCESPIITTDAHPPSPTPSFMYSIIMKHDFPIRELPPVPVEASPVGRPKSILSTDSGSLSGEVADRQSSQSRQSTTLSPLSASFLPPSFIPHSSVPKCPTYTSHASSSHRSSQSRQSTTLAPLSASFLPPSFIPHSSVPKRPTYTSHASSSQSSSQHSTPSSRPSVNSWNSGYMSSSLRSPNITTGEPDPTSPHSSHGTLDTKQLATDLESNTENSKEVFLSQRWPYILAFIIDTTPRQIYLHLLLRLPSLYFTRVTRIFQEAEVSILDIKEGILQTARQRDLPTDIADAWAFEPPVSSKPYERLNETWTAFIDSLLKEWKTLNIISVLLLTAILSVLQLDGAGTDPITRFTALTSMICALMSLLFGCMYIIRFGTMRKAYKAAEWASEAKRSKTGIFWNVWVMLAMPAAWLAWSMMSYIACIMCFVWRTGTLSDGNRAPFSDEDAFIPRIAVSVVLTFGLIYFLLIISTLRRYGSLMDRAWQRRIQDWLHDPDTGKVRYARTTSNTGTGQRFNPTFASGPGPNPSEPKRLKSAMGKGNKNCGIHWDSNVTTIEDKNASIATSPLEPIVEPMEYQPGDFIQPTAQVEFPHSESDSAFAPQGFPPLPMVRRPIAPPQPRVFPPSGSIPQPGSTSMTRNPNSVPLNGARHPRIRVARLLRLSNDPDKLTNHDTRNRTHEFPAIYCGLDDETWNTLNDDAQRAWIPPSSESQLMDENHPIRACIAHWNTIHFHPRLAQIQLCEEITASDRKFAIYYFETPGDLPYDDAQYDVSRLDVTTVDVLGAFGRVMRGDWGLKRLSLSAKRSYVLVGIVVPERLRAPMSRRASGVMIEEVPDPEADN
ncbi:hypothetical protein CVT24_000317 [Panaeolus cyanescens]|uniref:Uncharacterized protein n=1 Tax=Panaeolus cyanescens TaxID=181874 RepID=A0A409YCY5_9AGAR|nr:hypothetical protein CVT24_000317 [Panaeolus cyanescens]